MNGIIKDAELNSVELVERREQTMREKQRLNEKLNYVAPYRIKRIARTEIDMCEKRINELNKEIERRAIALREQNKIKTEGTTNAVQT